MNILSVSIALHVLGVVVWVGGMFFAYVCLRPAAATVLEPPQRLSLWVETFARFFPFVWLAILFILPSGYLLVFSTWGDFAHTPLYVHIMHALGIGMVLIFMHVFFAPYKRLRVAVSIKDWPAGGQQLAQIRRLVGINLSLGIIVVLVATVGRALLV
ncbi:MAG: CopD family protein [Gammaproteobacteria bacterium]